jgi:magnesium-transporting ATPase (P-type)
MPFSSSRKRMSISGTVLKDNEIDLLFVKGASEIILESCSEMYDNEGNIQILD